MRTLAIRIPLKDSDPDDIISTVDSSTDGQKYLTDLVNERFVDCELTVEIGDHTLKVSS